MSKQIATCCSPICTGVPTHMMSKKHFVIVDVPLSVSICPVCKYALRWVKNVKEKYRAISPRTPTKKQKDYGLNQKF